MWQQYQIIKTDTLTLREENFFFVLDLFIHFGVQVKISVKFTRISSII